MMSLDEILRGIGSQMARAATPPWSQQNPTPALVPQIQNPAMGPWAQAASSGLSSQNAWAGGPNLDSTNAWAGPSMGQGTDAWAQQSALSHIGAATAPPAVVAPATPAHRGTASANDAETEAYIRQAATSRGIDPNIAVRVWGGEGRSNYTGDNNSSFGPYQLHYGNVVTGGNSVSGLGDAFTKATGLDARDPATWQAQVDFALDNVKSGGWAPWHGAAAVGVGNMDGVGTRAAAAAPSAQQGQDILAQAQPFMGNAYVWGGKTAASGFDCSGLAGYLTTGQAESTRTLYAKSQAIDPALARPGDLVFYNMGNSTGPADEHVAVSIGNGKIVQSGGTAHNVNVAAANQFTAPGWQPEYRRLTGA